MNQEEIDDFRKAVDSYRVTVVVMGMVIIAVCSVFAYVLLFSVPHIVEETVVMALEQVLDNAVVHEDSEI